ncbi:MAG TPA: hypothetical protein VF748_14140 [Candidatus Acidoferrum sp.]
MADEDSSAAEKSDLISYAKYGERVLALCGYLLIVASMVSFAGVAAMKVWQAFHPLNPKAYERWLDFFVNESGTIMLLVVGILTAMLGIRLLTTVRLAGARTIPVEDLPLVRQAVIDGKPEPVDQYVRLRSLSGWAGNFTKLGVTGLPLTTVILTLIFSAVALIPTQHSQNFLDLAKLTLGAFIGSFVQRQVEQRRQETVQVGTAPRRPEMPV